MAAYSHKANIFARIFFIKLRISGHKILAALTLKPTSVLNVWSNLMQEICILRILITYIYGAIDNLYQKNVFFKLKLFFSIHCIRLVWYSHTYTCPHTLIINISVLTPLPLVIHMWLVSCSCSPLHAPVRKGLVKRVLLPCHRGT